MLEWFMILCQIDQKL